MTLEHHHCGQGCEAITGQDGNELVTPEVHIWYCQEYPTHFVYTTAGTRMLACERHAREWHDKFGWKIRRRPDKTTRRREK
jgi:hypothetical protein